MSALKQVVRDAAQRAGIIEPARRVRAALADERERRKRTDHAVLAPLLAAVLPRDAGTIDAGAHRGAVLGLFCRYAPDGRHVALEPIPALAADLRRRFPDADVVEAALAEAAGEVTFQYFPGHEDYSGIVPLAVPEPPQAITVRTVALDDLVEPAQRIHAMKVDVEGAELAALRGAERILREQQPVVVFEHTRAAALHGTSTREVHAVLTRAGLRVFSFSGAGPLDAAAFAHLVEVELHENFLARP